MPVSSQTEKRRGLFAAALSLPLGVALTGLTLFAAMPGFV